MREQGSPAAWCKNSRTSLDFESKGASVRVESPVVTVTYSPIGIQIGSTFFAWEGDQPPHAPQDEILEKTTRFAIQPRLGPEIEVSRERFGQLLKT